MTGQRLLVYVSTGTHADSTVVILTGINEILAGVPTDTATPAQKDALIRVAQTQLSACHVHATSAQRAALNTLGRWERDSCQEKTVQDIKIGWSDGNGFSLKQVGGKSVPRAAIRLQWPSTSTRCSLETTPN